MYDRCAFTYYLDELRTGIAYFFYWKCTMRIRRDSFVARIQSNQSRKGQYFVGQKAQYVELHTKTEVVIHSVQLVVIKNAHRRVCTDR